MKIFTKKGFVHKMILSLVILISVTAVVPNYSQAALFEDVGGALLKEIIQLVASLGDAVMGALNGMMLGTQGFGSAMIEQNDINMEDDSGSWLKTAPQGASVTTIEIEAGYMDENGLFDIGDYQIPNMLYCPENIFANKIAALDINFLNPNEYTSAVTGEVVEYNESDSAGDQDKQISGAAVLRTTIAKWYKAFRNIAVVGLLIVLVYLGIRILISTTANDKAKYKENLKDWLLALCLVFAMHFIMSGIIMVTDKFTELFSTSTSTIRVEVADGTWFYTNLTGLVRFKAQAEAWQDAVAYTIIYLALIIYTCMFTFMYFKRFLYTAFFTMISPLVALTYPIDKAGDRKAQAFNLWFKEYTMNVIIQPVHLLLYTALISSAMDLVANNPLYALVAIAFLVPAEKFIKKMFGIESETTSGVGSFAGGALAMQALNKLASGGKKGSSGGNPKGGESEDKKDQTKFKKNWGMFDNFEKDENANSDESNQPRELEAENPIAQNEDHQRMLDDREAWSQIANDEANSDFDREEAREQMAMIDDDMRQKGYLADKDDGDNGKEKEIQMANEPAEESRWQKSKRAIKGIAPYAGKAGKVLYKGAKGAAKLAAKTTATVGGAAIGLAAGLTTGDFSKTMTYMAGGAAAGGAIGNKVIGAAGAATDKAKDIKERAEDFAIEKTQGSQAVRQHQIERHNARARDAFLNDKKEIKKYKEMAGEMGYNGDIKDFMNAAADYKEAGVNDEKLIQNALKVEHKNGGVGGDKHGKVVDVASFTKDYGKEYIEDDKKRVALENVVQSKISNQDSQREIMETFADLHGRKEFYQKKSGIGVQKTAPNNSTASGSRKPRTTKK